MNVPAVITSSTLESKATHVIVANARANRICINGDAMILVDSNFKKAVVFSILAFSNLMLSAS